MSNSSLIYLFAGLGAVNGFIFGGYLLFSKIGNRRANVFLGIFLLLLSVRFFRSIHFQQFGPDRPLFLVAHLAFLLAIPFLYFYFRASLRGEFRFRYFDLLHLSPLLVILIESFNYKNIVSFVFLLFYAGLSHKELLRFSSKVKASSVSLQSHNYYWYRNLLIIIYVNVIIYITNLLFHFVPYVLGAVSYSVIFYLMLFYWNRYQQYHKQRKILRKYTHSGLDDDAAEGYKQLLFEKISGEKLYLDPDLNLKRLADLISIPYYQLSQIINQHLGKNFTEFINEYRVNEARKLLIDPNKFHEKVESIAYDSGFSNPSSFYSAFKKIANTTPTQYRKTFFENKKSSPNL